MRTLTIFTLLLSSCGDIPTAPRRAPTGIEPNDCVRLKTRKLAVTGVIVGKEKPEGCRFIGEIYVDQVPVRVELYLDCGAFVKVDNTPACEAVRLDIENGIIDGEY